MDLARVSPELRRDAARVSRLSVTGPIARRLAQAVLTLVPAARVQGVRIEIRSDVGAGVRIYHPEARRGSGTLLWVHGGGFLIGRAVQDDAFCAATALALAMPVVSAEYRLAPANPFPAALDDCHAAWSWLMESAPALGVDRHRIAVGGVSAGAGLAATLVQRLVDAGGARPVAQWLFSPMLDDRTAARRELDTVNHLVWDNRRNAVGWRAYLGAAPGSAELPPYAAAARRADLHGCPPTWIGVGDIDLFHDEDVAYAERLRAAGAPVEVLVAPGAPHGFESWARRSEIAVSYTAAARRWLACVLGDEGGASLSA